MYVFTRWWRDGGICMHIAPSYHLSKIIEALF